MQILAVDIGTGTQDILLFDSERAPENCLKLVMPSPTLLIGQRIRRATAARRPLLLTGVIMGGGPSSWAIEGHRRAGLRVVATPDTARTLNDDLDLVQRELGVEIVDEDEARQLAAKRRYVHIECRDFEYAAIRRAFAAFGLNLQPDALAVAVFDHGAAPPDVSDRQYRMDYLVDRLRRDQRLSTFAALGDRVPAIMTRLAAVAGTAARATQSSECPAGKPVVVMDTAPAAVLGALDDPVVARCGNALVVNVGNFHTLAFQYRAGRLARLFEHHTGVLTAGALVGWLGALADGTITHDAVFADHGHGALALDDTPVPLELVAVTGPRQTLLRGTGLPVHAAVPHGDQMLAGCFGLLRACADLQPAWRTDITAALSGEGDRSLW